MTLAPALFGVVVGIGLVDLYLVAERGYQWLRRAGRRHRGRAFVRTFQTRAVELRRTPLAPARPAPTGTFEERPVGAPSGRPVATPSLRSGLPTPVGAVTPCTAPTGLQGVRRG